tara:strand:+ start:89 stop:952 length:864 start_codon:yes stop_codon:yes gene_type:complete
MNRISYSQLSTYNQCPWKWKLDYIDNLREFRGNIHTLFGTAMHEVMQTYFEVMYNVTAKKANELNLNEMLHNKMIEQFKLIKDDTGEYPATQEDMAEFYNDGITILDWFVKHRGDYFSKKGYSLIGCEVPIEVGMEKNIKMVGYLDLVIKDELRDVIKIIDIKTSTMGWNKYMKADFNKTSQLVLYKEFYSKQYNHPVDKIDIEFFIVKRKLWENAMFPQKRVQKFVPASGKPTRNKVMNSLNSFVEDSFKDNGEYNLEHTYIKKASTKNCKWCEYKSKPELCDRGK